MSSNIWSKATNKIFYCSWKVEDFLVPFLPYWTQCSSLDSFKASCKSEHWQALTQKIESEIANFAKEERKRQLCRIAQQEREEDEKEERT